MGSGRANQGETWELVLACRYCSRLNIGCDRSTVGVEAAEIAANVGCARASGIAEERRGASSTHGLVRVWQTVEESLSMGRKMAVSRYDWMHVRSHSLALEVGGHHEGPDGKWANKTAIASEYSTEWCDLVARHMDRLIGERHGHRC
jgi:hypothetical protein